MAKHWLKATLSNPAWGFGPAFEDEQIVFGARRPGFPFSPVPQEGVARWIGFVQGRDVRRVVCLLPTEQLASYPDLLEAYRDAFGAERLCWAPILDFHLADEATLTQTILPFLFDARTRQEKTVVHCAGGIGRTGHVLAAWLVSAHGLSNSAAIEAVKRNGRNARESRDPRLDALLDACRAKFAPPEVRNDDELSR